MTRVSKPQNNRGGKPRYDRGGKLKNDKHIYKKHVKKIKFLY